MIHRKVKKDLLLTRILFCKGQIKQIKSIQACYKLPLNLQTPTAQSPLTEFEKFSRIMLFSGVVQNIQIFFMQNLRWS